VLLLQPTDSGNSAQAHRPASHPGAGLAAGGNLSALSWRAVAAPIVLSWRAVAAPIVLSWRAVAAPSITAWTLGRFATSASASTADRVRCTT
jgi:hypothetical protein